MVVCKVIKVIIFVLCFGILLVLVISDICFRKFVSILVLGMFLLFGLSVVVFFWLVLNLCVMLINLLRLFRWVNFCGLVDVFSLWWYLVCFSIVLISFFRLLLRWFCSLLNILMKFVIVFFVWVFSIGILFWVVVMSVLLKLMLVFLVYIVIYVLV